MPKLREMIARTKTKIYCKGTIRRRCIIAALQTVKLGLTKFGNQAKPHKYCEKKVVFLNNLEQMFKRTVTDLDIQPTRTQQRMMCARKNARLLPQLYGQ